MYEGYLRLGAMELVNASRVTAYVEHMLPGFGLYNKYEVESIPATQEEVAYRTPMLDDADWVDRREPISFDFLGVYPLGIQNVDSSTMQTPYTESIGNGGATGFPRHASREIRVRALLVAKSDLALEYGMAWLRTSLSTQQCSSHDGGCGTNDLSYFAAYPDIDPECVDPDTGQVIPLDEQLFPYQRAMHGVTVLSGPTTIVDKQLREGAMREVEILLLATTPFEFSMPRWGGTVSLSESNVPNVVCAVPNTAPLVDPALPVIPDPPRPPAITVDGVADVASWRRHWITPPAYGGDGSPLVPLWKSSVPTLRVVTGASAARNVRVRFYPNPFSRPSSQIDPCSFCAEFIISYIPPNAAVTIDGVSQHAWASMNMAGTVSADHILRGTGGVPMSWPELSCGMDYLISLDIPQASVLPGYVEPSFALSFTDRG